MASEAGGAQRVAGVKARVRGGRRASRPRTAGSPLQRRMAPRRRRRRACSQIHRGSSPSHILIQALKISTRNHPPKNCESGGRWCLSASPLNFRQAMGLVYLFGSTTASSVPPCDTVWQSPGA